MSFDDFTNEFTLAGPRAAAGAQSQINALKAKNGQNKRRLLKTQLFQSLPSRSTVEKKDEEQSEESSWFVGDPEQGASRDAVASLFRKTEDSYK